MWTSISSRRVTVLCAIAVTAILAAPCATWAISISVGEGWDLFETGPGTEFLSFQFEGVPLGSFDFGGTTGVKGTGFADTIVKRLDDAEVVLPGETATIEIEIVALQLRSVSPIDIGAGTDFHYVTLSPAPPSVGAMGITFDDANGGTFDSFFDVFVDIRIGELHGPIIQSFELDLSANNVPWDRTAPPDAIVIPGVNFLLNGSDTSTDFWPIGPFEEQKPDFAVHVVDAATVPEPVTMAATAIALTALGGYLRKRRKA